MDTVMLTGATGFVGGRLAHQLLDDGYDLRLLVRSPSKAKKLEERGAEIIEGDLLDTESIRRAVKGADGVFHLAAAYLLGGDYEWMRQVNVEGTRNVLDAAKEEEVEKIIYCGSDTSLGDTNGRICDEAKEHDGDFRSNYARTKHESHKLVEERMDNGEPIIHGVVSSVYGPGDESPIADLIKMHLAGHAVAYLDRDAGYTFTHVDDVAEALKLAYENGEIGESYIISGEPATFEQFFKKLSEQTGIPEPRFEVPDWIVNVTKPVVKGIAGILGKSASEIDEMISMGRNVTRFFSSAKANDELDANFRSLKEGLGDTLPSFAKKELKEARNLLKLTGYPLAGLAIFDIALGSTAAFLPGLYDQIIHTGFSDIGTSPSTVLIRRTGTLWLIFAGVQGIAALEPVRRKSWVFAAGVLRLMDVPADPVYFLSSENLTFLGKLGLLSAPIFNFISGSIFVYASYRGFRSLKWKGELISDK